MAGNKLTKEQLIILAYKIHNAEFETEEGRDELLWQFLENVPDPEAVNLFRQINPELTPEQIIEKALSYKPLITPPPSK